MAVYGKKRSASNVIKRTRLQLSTARSRDAARIYNSTGDVLIGAGLGASVMMSPLVGATAVGIGLVSKGLGSFVGNVGPKLDKKKMDRLDRIDAFREKYGKGASKKQPPKRQVVAGIANAGKVASQAGGANGKVKAHVRKTTGGKMAFVKAHFRNVG